MFGGGHAFPKNPPQPCHAMQKAKVLPALDLEAKEEKEVGETGMLFPSSLGKKQQHCLPCLENVCLVLPAFLFLKSMLVHML